MTTDDAQEPSDHEIDQRQAEVREQAQQLWDGASITAASHPYAALERWGNSALRLKVYRGDLLIDDVRCDGALLMSMRDHDGVVWNVGFITAISTTRFLPGGRIAGTFFGWGADRSTIVVCRTFAKAAEINTACHVAVAIASTADNVRNVVGVMQAKYPAARVVPEAEFHFGSQRSRGETLAGTAGAAPVNGAVTLADLESARDAPGHSRPTEHSRTLLSWIKRKGLAEFKRSRVLQFGPACVRNAEAAKTALLTLVEQGYLITEDANRYRVTSAVQSLRERSFSTAKASLDTAATNAGATSSAANTDSGATTVAERVATDTLAISDAGNPA